MDIVIVNIVIGSMVTGAHIHTGVIRAITVVKSGVCALFLRCNLQIDQVLQRLIEIFIIAVARVGLIRCRVGVNIAGGMSFFV